MVELIGIMICLFLGSERAQRPMSDGHGLSRRVCETLSDSTTSMVDFGFVDDVLPLETANGVA